MLIFIESLLHFAWKDAIDIIIVAFLLYQLYNLVRGTGAPAIFLGIGTVYVIWKIVDVFELNLLSEILGQFISVGVIALIIVFQPEIRKFLLLLGNSSLLSQNRRRFLFWRVPIYRSNLLDTNALLESVYKMSASNTGALIVLTRQNELKDILLSGVRMNAVVSPALIESTFYKNAPLHDGAMIITNNKIAAARCILPVSRSESLPESAGLRHRAAMGVSEISDAIVLVVSEQTGRVSVVEAGQIIGPLSFEELQELLTVRFN